MKRIANGEKAAMYRRAETFEGSTMGHTSNAVARMQAVRPGTWVPEITCRIAGIKSPSNIRSARMLATPYTIKHPSIKRPAELFPVAKARSEARDVTSVYLLATMRTMRERQEKHAERLSTTIPRTRPTLEKA